MMRSHQGRRPGEAQRNPQSVREARWYNRRRRSNLLPWSGTFHSIGNRLLRQYAGSLALDPADLMDVVRGDLGLARTRSRFPKKGTCLAIYSYTVNVGRPLREILADPYHGAADGKPS